MMKKTAILALSTVLASQLMGAEDLSEMIKEGKAGGYIRLHHIVEEATDPGIAYTGSVIAGKLKYHTGALYGLRFGAAMYTAHDTGLTDMDKRATSEVAGGLLGDDFGNYSTLGESYVSYRLSNTDLTYGRQEFKTPMTESPVTFIPNLFQGAVATIKEIPNTTITAAHITHMQYGTRSLTERNLIGDVTYGITTGTGITATTTPTSGVFTEGGLSPTWGKEKFQDMGLAMFGRNANGAQRVDSAGVTSLGIDYKSGDFQARVWDYYAHEMYNTVYADAEYKLNAGPAKVTLAAQVLKQDDVGNFENNFGGTALKANVGATRLPIDGGAVIYRTKISADGSIDAMFWGAKAKAEVGDFSFEAAFNKNEDGHVINTWGGDPGFTSTIFSRNEFRADTTAYRLGFEYNLKSFVPGLKFIYNHAQYDSDVKTYHATTQAFLGIRGESTDVNDYVLHYVVPSVKGLWFRLFHVDRYSATREYNQAHTRLIANLNF
jgi:hypothetical protein